MKLQDLQARRALEKHTEQVLGTPFVNRGLHQQMSDLTFWARLLKRMGEPGPAEKVNKAIESLEQAREDLD